MSAQEEISAHIHVVIDDTVYRLSVVSAGIVTDEDHAILKGLNYFNPSADKLLEDGKVVWNIAEDRVFLFADQQNFHEEAPWVLVVSIIAQLPGKVNPIL